MKPFIADLLRNPNVPKSIRFVVASLVCGFVMAIGLLVAWGSPFLFGRIFGGLLAAVFLVIYFYLIIFIYRE